MNRKFAVAALIVLVASLLTSTSASANFNAVSGQLKDGKTGNDWTHGGTVYVYSCANINDGAELRSVALADGSAGSFTVSPIVNPGVDRFLCIKVTFNAAGGNPASADYWKVLQDVAENSGTIDAGVFYTNTGPTAVTLRDLNATTSATPWSLILAAVVVVAAMVALSLVLRRRAARA